MVYYLYDSIKNQRKYWTWPRFKFHMNELKIEFIEKFDIVFCNIWRRIISVQLQLFTQNESLLCSYVCAFHLYHYTRFNPHNLEINVFTFMLQVYGMITKP
jgi:hypothetical protein